MKLDIVEILNNVGMRTAYTVNEPPFVDEDLECCAPVEGKLTFTNTGNILVIDGRIQTSVMVSCGRCLVYFEQPVDAAIEEQFEMENKLAGPRGHPAQVVVEEDENPDAGKLFDGTLFDLTELIRQNIMISLPVNPLHDEDCKGLCLTCGVNLNESACNCDQRVIHPSMERLGELLKKNNYTGEEAE